MNYVMILNVLGWVSCFNAAFHLLPALTGLIYSEKAGFSFLISAVASLVFGLMLLIKKPKTKRLYAKEGFVIVSLSWIIMSLFGALPLFLCNAVPTYLDGVFEAASGFTTTGASIIPSVEDIPRCCLLWRSFMHWVGGMGVLVFVMAFVPLSGAGNMNMMRAESPGPMVGKLVPKVRSTAFLLYAIYFGLTIMEFIILLFARMSVFDAVNTALSTAGTGGFGFRNDSMASFSPAIQNIVTVFMILFGVNFNLYFLLLYKHWKDAFKISEVWAYLAIIVVSTILITINISSMYTSVGEAARHSAFTVGSIITTTGFATTDFDLWPEFSKNILQIIMFIGACAGSTGGGMKISRIILMIKTALKELSVQIHPKLVRKIKMDGHEISHETIRAMNNYLIAYIIVFIFSMIIISIENYDFRTNFSAVATTLGNVGPGFNLCGPTCNFAFFSNTSKLVFIFDMLAGRLELFPMLILLSPATWKKQ